MHPRLAEEWAEIRDLYPCATHLGDPERLELEIELEHGLYSAPTTTVAVLIPTGYRATGPDGFLIPAGLTLSNGDPLPVSDGAGLGMPGWLLVSFHHIDANGVSTWHPSADFRVGDNLISYMSSVEHFLGRGCN